MIIEGLVALAIAGIAHYTGIARGRYGDKKTRLQSNTCDCKHGKHLHHSKGFSRCGWQSEDAEYMCLCKHFVPKETNED